MNRSLIVITIIALNALAEARPPNVLLIVSEDNGPEIGCYGTPIETPHLDKLAGLIFAGDFRLPARRLDFHGSPA